MRALTVPIRGITHPNKRGPTRAFGIKLCAPGDLLELRPEPKNRHDGNAIAIYERGGIQLGYVPADKCQWFHSAMSRGVEIVAVFQEANEHGAFVRVGFDHTPALPERQTNDRYQFDEDFPPDPIYDED